VKNLLTLGLLLSTIFVFSQNQENGRSFIKSLFEEKDIQKTYAYLDPAAQAKITEKGLKDMQEQLQVQLGKFLSIIESNIEEKNYYYFTAFEKMKLDIKITFSENKMISGFLFVPHKEFNQKKLGTELDIESGTIKLHGTLLNPNGDSKKLVIFVHGSGPQDRDETLIENKPFKDIAENLFQNGIASYRFDKRTLSNPESFNDKSTIDDEVTNDVINVVKYFRNSKEFAASEIIILGHSLGAYMLPRIANKSDQIGKIILLAGNSRPISQLVTEQFDYLLKVNPTPELEKDSKKMKTQISYLSSKEFNLNSPKESLPFNMSAYYWKSMQEYNPLKEIKKIKIPILILQGERDYQVSMTDFELWHSNLKNHDNASFISYPKLNHLFIIGEKPSTPQEYAIKGNVDTSVITDISNFIAK